MSRFLVTVGADVRCYGTIEVDARDAFEAEAKAEALLDLGEGPMLYPDWSTLDGEEVILLREVEQ